MRLFKLQLAILSSLCIISGILKASEPVIVGDYTLEAGHPSLQKWLLPEPGFPTSNEPTPDSVALGEKLFFDRRLSGNGDMSCATCHQPDLGWSDGLKTATGANGKKLGRGTPTIINTAYGFLNMWDGRFETLEDQVLEPITNSDEMNMTIDSVLSFLKKDAEYSEAFARAYPSQGLTIKTLSMAIASFERTIISKDSDFDRWVRGDRFAMTESQINGFEVFIDSEKGNCEICHSPPNFSDDGFHNIGLSTNKVFADNGRYEIVPIRVMKGAFKTPTLREIQLTKPYFHDGSAETLAAVLEHYVSVDNKNNTFSPSLKRAKMSESEKKNLLDFLTTLTGKPQNGSANTGSTVKTHSALINDE